VSADWQGDASMGPFRNRLKTPEEIELGKKREELSLFQEQLAGLERAYADLKGEIRLFEQSYERILGGRIAELEDLEWQLKGLLGSDEERLGKGSADQEETFAQFRHRTDLLDDDIPTDPDQPQKSLKQLYREVAKSIHPDLASDEEERLRRQELMALANQAYAVGDRGALEEILSDWELGPEMTSQMDVAMELVAVIRLIARAQQNIHAVACQIDELRATDIYSFKLRVDEARADGSDLMAEMAATVDLDITKTRRRLAALRGDSDGAEERNSPPLETRLVRFPVEYSCGTLYERSGGSVDYRDWQRIGNARGAREVYLDKSLRLDVRGSSEVKLRFLDSLRPDDLQALFLYDIDDGALPHLAQLSGLNELYLSNTTISDQGLCQLNLLHGLRRLYIYNTAIGDAGLLNLASMTGLKWLTCSGTAITEAGLARFRQLLPGCKLVSFTWRHGK